MPYHCSHLPLLLFAIYALMPFAQAAEPPILKPWDFRPLTELPWEKQDATQETIMDAIFREPDASVRYMVLQLYLGEIPVEQIGQVFDLAIEHEDSETPDHLVQAMLLTWARLDPVRCLERVQTLFSVVGLEDGWLMFDDWDVNRSSMLVQDRAAIQASPFRLRRWSLIGFPAGVDMSELPSADRVRLMKAFIQRWLAVFDDYPGSYGEITDARTDHTFLEAFKVSTDSIKTFCEQRLEGDGVGAALSVALRRWMVAEPSDASTILELTGKLKEKAGYIRYDFPPMQELLRLWAEVDRPGMMKWADSSGSARGLVNLGRGFLLSEMDAATRQRWLAEANGREDDDFTRDLLQCWAAWDPKGALEAAKNIDPDWLNSVAGAAAEGPYLTTIKAGRLGFDAVRDFELNTLPRDDWEDLLDDWGMSPMEGWGSVDAGATARFGIVQLNRYGWYGFPKDEVIEFFAGRNNEYRDNSSVIDRTFCALRTWAATKPNEMKAWITTLPDAKLRDALTWLADNPWGPGRIPPPP